MEIMERIIVKATIMKSTINGDNEDNYNNNINYDHHNNDDNDNDNKNNQKIEYE